MNTDGELDEEVYFAFWIDDGDNVYESDEGNEGIPEEIFLSGPLSGLGAAGQIALADSLNGPAIPGGETFYIGKAWCFGTLTDAVVPQDGLNTSGPLDGRGTGFVCDGTLVDNAAQTDRVVGDIQFYAEQARNNDTFQCQSWTPEWPAVEVGPTGENGPPV